MELADIRKHWEQWAAAGVDVRATTKTPTIKLLEIDALGRAIRHLGLSDDHPRRILEVGCGNGHNCLTLARELPNFSFHGFDYVPEMITSAQRLAASQGLANRCRFMVGDVLKMDQISVLEPNYDVVFTDRLIINLNTETLQDTAIRHCCHRVTPGGALLLLENFRECYERQNTAREWLGLCRRTPEPFNRFVDGDHMIGLGRALGLDLVMIDDFGSLHDLLLYVLIPAINGGVVDYDHPMVAAAAELCTKAAVMMPSSFGSFGQNRLFVYRKPT